MPVNQLYRTWPDQIRQLRPQARKTLVHNFIWLLIGIYWSRKVHLSPIAKHLPGSAKLHSTVQRLRRLPQRAIRVRKGYGPIGEALRTYRKRMWIEEMLGDLKGHGFKLEDSHLRHLWPNVG